MATEGGVCVCGGGVALHRPSFNPCAGERYCRPRSAGTTSICRRRVDRPLEMRVGTVSFHFRNGSRQIQKEETVERVVTFDVGRKTGRPLAVALLAVVHHRDADFGSGENHVRSRARHLRAMAKHHCQVSMEHSTSSSIQGTEWNLRLIFLRPRTFPAPAPSITHRWSVGNQLRRTWLLEGFFVENCSDARWTAAGFWRRPVVDLSRSPALLLASRFSFVFGCWTSKFACRPEPTCSRVAYVAHPVKKKSGVKPSKKEQKIKQKQKPPTRRPSGGAPWGVRTGPISNPVETHLGKYTRKKR